jgi:hypothetical protein
MLLSRGQKIIRSGSDRTVLACPDNPPSIAEIETCTSIGEGDKAGNCLRITGLHKDAPDIRSCRTRFHTDFLGGKTKGLLSQAGRRLILNPLGGPALEKAHRDHAPGPVKEQTDACPPPTRDGSEATPFRSLTP